jgi:hypothetical protein
MKSKNSCYIFAIVVLVALATVSWSVPTECTNACGTGKTASCDATCASGAAAGNAACDAATAGTVCCCKDSAAATVPAACQTACGAGRTAFCDATCGGSIAATAGDSACNAATFGMICCCVETAPGSGKTATEKSGFVKKECECTCGTKKIKAVGMYKPGLLDFTGDQKALDNCDAQCARTCGGFTDCAKQADSECETCCTDYCSTKYSGRSSWTGTVNPCNAACKSTCKFKGTVNGITDIIYMIAGLLGALMITIHGIRMVTSQDPHDRDAAKSSIIHVIIALIIIAMAAVLVNMFITMGGVGTTSGDGGTPAVGCDSLCSNNYVCKSTACSAGQTLKAEGNDWCQTKFGSSNCCCKA